MPGEVQAYVVIEKVSSYTVSLAVSPSPDRKSPEGFVVETATVPSKDNMMVLNRSGCDHALNGNEPLNGTDWANLWDVIFPQHVAWSWWIYLPLNSRKSLFSNRFSVTKIDRRFNRI